MKGEILLLAMLALSFNVFSQVKTEKVNPHQIPQRIRKAGKRSISISIYRKEKFRAKLIAQRGKDAQASGL